MGLSPGAHLKRSIGRVVKMLVFSPIVLSLFVYIGLIYSYFYLLFIDSIKLMFSLDCNLSVRRRSIHALRCISSGSKYPYSFYYSGCSAACQPENV
jgi:hypothetical protein